MDKQKRRELMKELKRKAEAEEVERMPISREDLGGLFDWLDGDYECDNRLTRTCEYLEKKGLNTAVIVSWLQEYGGYCDCEVLANVEERWGDFIEGD